MSDKRLRIGFIGCGSHASMCIYPALRMGGKNIFSKIPMPVDLVAVADLNEELARRNARDFGAQRHYTNHKALLEKEQIDAVFIVAGGKIHYQLCLDALAAGLPVFVEKPPAWNSQETMELIRASQRAGKPLMTAFMKRFATGYRMARQISQTPDFGAVNFVNVAMTGGPVASGGDGFEKDYFIHGIDLLHYFGGDVAELTAYESRDSRATGYAISLRYTSGAIGTMQFHSQHSFGEPSERLQVSGFGRHCTVDNVTSVKYSRGPKACWDRPDQQFDLEHDTVAFEPNWTMPRDDNSSLFHLGYVGEVAHFVDCVLNNKPLSTSVVDAHKAMVFIEAMMASKGKPVQIDYRL